MDPEAFSPYLSNRWHESLKTTHDHALQLKNNGSLRVIILPGNGGSNTDIRYANWYNWLAKEIESSYSVPVLLTNFPDPLYARENVWIPFVVDYLGADENTILVGHSSGAVCCLRILERCVWFLVLDLPHIRIPHTNKPGTRSVGSY
eukprot:TRINITY_DN1257_c0_g1_i2.p1 TRINITY_DN1257_c0_g1~~TRINITY_DN1257_c0_g1_i2.p1  ORF type:complete len:147 (+),score=18.67 TRINITY_DN1257_c0_g1_i2:104-544(+)